MERAGYKVGGVIVKERTTEDKVAWLISQVALLQARLNQIERQSEEKRCPVCNLPDPEGNPYCFCVSQAATGDEFTAAETADAFMRDKSIKVDPAPTPFQDMLRNEKPNRIL